MRRAALHRTIKALRPFRVQSLANGTYKVEVRGEKALGVLRRLTVAQWLEDYLNGKDAKP